jgi:hypothetical protein
MRPVGRPAGSRRWPLLGPESHALVQIQAQAVSVLPTLMALHNRESFATTWEATRWRTAKARAIQPAARNRPDRRLWPCLPQDKAFQRHRRPLLSFPFRWRLLWTGLRHPSVDTRWRIGLWGAMPRRKTLRLGKGGRSANSPPVLTTSLANKLEKGLVHERHQQG